MFILKSPILIRGHPSSKRWPKEHRELLLSLLQTDWEGFGPTFASDKLWDIYGIDVHAETIRLFMTAEGYWKRRGKIRTHRKRRKRMECSHDS